MKYWLPVLLLLGSCKGGSQSSGNVLSIIVFTDTVIAYSGALNVSTHIDSIAVNEKSIKSLISEEMKSKGDKLVVLVKPAWYANAGGNAQNILAWCRQAGLAKVNISSIDAGEEMFFKVTGPKADAEGLTKPLELHLPVEESDKAMPKTAEKAYTILLLKDNMVYVYAGGDINSKIFYGRLNDTLFSSVLIAGKKEFGKDYFITIKPLEGTTYKNTVDILDEMLTDDIKKYQILSPGSEEIDFAETLQKSM